MRAELARIVTAVAFQSAESFSFAGKPSSYWVGPPASTLVQTLQNVLYGTCYTRQFKGVLDEATLKASSNDEGWIELLSAANASRERWDEGWEVQQFLPTGEVYAKKGALQRSFWPGEFINRGVFGRAPAKGDSIAVFLPREARNAQSGFYYVFGETHAAVGDELPTVRYYWNLKREGAAPLVQSLTSSLNRFQVPFRFKIVSHPAFLDRSDTAVLYVGRRYYRIAAEIALAVRHELAFGLDEDVPLFTLRLGKGLAFAEDPGTQESFGMSRCRLFAEGLWLAFCEGRSQIEDRLQRVQQHFAAAGTSLERPYLNLAAMNSYEFPQ